MSKENKQKDVCQSGKYIPIHDHGFVGFVDSMGSDEAIVQAARVSYGKGTKSVSDDKNLIRYLVRHKHTTPLEMCEFKFHIKCPIFVMRQWVRHRTASINEYSGRYSVMSEDFYVPTLDYVAGQSSQNKQGRNEVDDSISDEDKRNAQLLIDRHMGSSKKSYATLMGDEENGLNHNFSENFIENKGLAKELARVVLPVANYTEFYWKINLHNLFHFLKLRMDKHAQREIRDFADAVYKLLKTYGNVDAAIEAFEDYILNAKNFSKAEMEILQFNMQCFTEENLRKQCEEKNLSKRETDEFLLKMFPTK